MWKKAVMGVAAAAAALTMSACGSASQENSGSAAAAVPGGKSIVVYYSATGNTKRAAETIAKETGSDIYAITPKVPYTEADLDYNNSASRVSKEHKDSSIRPAYTGDVENWNDYKVVYLGYPIWWGEAPAIVYTFTEHHSFEGKTDSLCHLLQQSLGRQRRKPLPGCQNGHLASRRMLHRRRENRRCTRVDSFFKKVRKDGQMKAEEIKKALEGKGAVMEVGSPNDAYAPYFTGKSWLASLSEDKDIPVYNVTFENGAHTHWHIHHGTSQVLIVVSGKGYLQYEGQAPRQLHPGDVVTIPPEVKHWHGAAPGCHFQHISLSREGKGISNEWLEPVDEREFEKL